MMIVLVNCGVLHVVIIMAFGQRLNGLNTVYMYLILKTSSLGDLVVKIAKMENLNIL